MNYSRNRRYFQADAKPLGFAVILVIVAIILLIANVRPLIPIIMLLIGAVLIAVYFLSQIPDSEIDAAVSARLSTLMQNARDQLEIPEDVPLATDPLIFHGYSFRNGHVREGRDKLLRAPLYEATVIFCTEDVLHAYTLEFSLVEPRENGYTFSATYDDLASVAIQPDVFTAGAYSFRKESLRLTSRGCSALSCCISSAEAQQAVRILRRVIFEKKQA